MLFLKALSLLINDNSAAGIQPTGKCWILCGGIDIDVSLIL